MMGMDNAPRYTFKVMDVEKVTDGDTFWLRLDVGFRQQMLTNIRLLGFDAPERHKGSTEEKALAAKATGITEDFLTEGATAGTLWVRTEPDPDDFGRWLGEVYTDTPDGEEVKREYLGTVLRSKDLASKWPTRWHEEFDSGR